MNLAVFDIDGTLTNTGHAYCACYARAVSEVLQQPVKESDWRHSRHITDGGVLEFLFDQFAGRKPKETEREQFISLHSRYFHETLQAEKEIFAEIPGAGAILQLLHANPDWMVALATGGWFDLTGPKLEIAGIEAASFAWACADDGLTREEIVLTAIDRAKEKSGRGKNFEFSRVVSIGDGLWDVRTAAGLSLPFIGVASGERAEALRGAGAKHVIGHYQNAEQFLQLLHEAEIPAR